MRWRFSVESENSAEDRGWALTLLERSIATLAEPAPTRAGLTRPADGVLGPSRCARLRDEARVEVLGPLARALAHPEPRAAALCGAVT